MTMKITAAELRAKHACEVQVRQFEALFPNGVEITSELCVQHACSFDWSWAAKNFLPPGKYADYELKHAWLWADCRAEHAALYADYEAKIAALFASLAE